MKVKLIEHIGSRETILFHPELTIEGDVITILPHTAYIRDKKFELESQTFDNPESVWFNFENHTLEEKELKPGAFRFLSKNEEGEYSLIRYTEPPSMAEAAPETIPKETPASPIIEPIQEAPVVKSTFWERLKKFWRK